MSPLCHGAYRNSNLVSLISDKGIHLTTEISQFILSCKNFTRIKSTLKWMAHMSIKPSVISTMFPPSELTLDPDLTLRKEATMFSLIWGRQCYLATKWTIFAVKHHTFLFHGLPFFSQLSILHHLLMRCPPFWYIWGYFYRYKIKQMMAWEENTNEKSLAEQPMGKKRRRVIQKEKEV